MEWHCQMGNMGNGNGIDCTYKKRNILLSYGVALIHICWSACAEAVLTPVPVSTLLHMRCHRVTSISHTNLQSAAIVLNTNNSLIIISFLIAF